MDDEHRIIHSVLRSMLDLATKTGPFIKKEEKVKSIGHKPRNCINKTVGFAVKNVSWSDRMRSCNLARAGNAKQTGKSGQ